MSTLQRLAYFYNFAEISNLVLVHRSYYQKLTTALQYQDAMCHYNLEGMASKAMNKSKIESYGLVRNKYTQNTIIKRTSLELPTGT